MLSSGDFAAFFEEVYGYAPFPWQERLLSYILKNAAWPSVLDLPTGSGKTAAIDIAVFHLAIQAEHREARHAPVRIAFVVDRRLVVDDAYERANKLEHALSQPRGPATTRVAESLKVLSRDGPPLLSRRLRGGIPREDDWARTPSQPTVLCSTVDQVGSRLLFRGYGVSNSMKPVHAGLTGSDCLILLDEAHLAEPFRQTLKWIDLYRGPNWRESQTATPWGVAVLTATPGEDQYADFALDDEDKVHPVLRRRLEASKPARLVPPAKPKKEDTTKGQEEVNDDDSGKDLMRRVAVLANEVSKAVEHFKKPESGASAPAIGVVVNRVARARAVFERLRCQFQEQIGTGVVAEPILLIGPGRPVDRDKQAESLRPIRTRTREEADSRALERILIVVATQCIEAGVDIDLDALITEVAPLDCLRQRFGRLNRAGRNIMPYAAIVADKSDISARVSDPVYGKAIAATWESLRASARSQVVEFGLNGFAVSFTNDTLSPKEDAPILLPAHLDLLSQTSPIPAADPDVGLFLHGIRREPDSLTIVWRADLDPERRDDDSVRRLLLLVPPRSLEAIELPIWAVQRWLAGRDQAQPDLADAPAAAPEEDQGRRAPDRERHVFRWRGHDESSCWVRPAELRPGDTLVVPASYGGIDDFGWNPNLKDTAKEVAREAAALFAARRFAVRVAPGLLEGAMEDDDLAEVLAKAASSRWQDVREALLDCNLPQSIREDLEALEMANRPTSTAAHLDLYGTNDGRPRGIVFVAPFGVKGRDHLADGPLTTTEDDFSGSLAGFLLPLAQHNEDVGQQAKIFAKAAGLADERVADIELAAILHDSGKADSRFQAWLHYGDALGLDTDRPEEILAKSARPLPPAARTQSGLPDHWRHEARSVRLAIFDGQLGAAKDAELVAWLIGSHHGHGRPFFPHHDPTEQVPNIGPQSLAFDWNGFDWPSLFERLKTRYGVWELARMEAILRLADHRASERARDRAAKDAE